MSTILTQEEIDALLNQIQAGEPEPAETPPDTAATGSYHKYDFGTANKFSKEQMRTLRIIYENFCYLLSSRLTVMLRTSCEASVISLEEVRFGEFNNSIPDPTVLAIVDSPPFNGSTLLEISSAVAYGIISRLFGGTADAVPITKNFTEIELAMLGNVLSQLLSLMKESWLKVVDINATLQRLETSPQFTQIAASNEAAAIITLNVRIDQAEDILAFCLPHYVIQPIAKKLNTTQWTLSNAGQQGSDALTDQSKNIAKRVATGPMTLRAVLDSIEAPFSDLMRLKPGDVLCLDHRIDQYITVLMNTVPKFRGIIGVRDQHQVIQIAEIIKESDSLE